MMVAREKGFSLKDAVEHYATHLESLNHSASIETAIEEFLAIREAEGNAKAHLIDLRRRLNRFAREFGTRLAASMSTKELDGWLHGLPVAPQTRASSVDVASSWKGRSLFLRLLLPLRLSETFGQSGVGQSLLPGRRGDPR